MSKRFPTHGLLIGAALVTGIGICYALAAQPHMEAAIDSCRARAANCKPPPPATRSNFSKRGNRNFWKDTLRAELSEAPGSASRALLLSRVGADAIAPFGLGAVERAVGPPVERAGVAVVAAFGQADRHGDRDHAAGGVDDKPLLLDR